MVRKRAFDVPTWDDILKGYEESEWWHPYPATEKQIEALTRRGWTPQEIVTKGEAAFVLGRPSCRRSTSNKKTMTTTIDCHFLFGGFDQ